MSEIFQILYFQLRHSAMAPPSVVETKLNAGEQLQTVPYPTAPKLFLYPQRLRGDVVRTIFVISKRDGQKNFYAPPPAANEVLSPPNLA